MKKVGFSLLVLISLGATGIVVYSSFRRRPDFPKPTKGQLQKIEQLREELQSASRARRHFRIDDKMADEIGESGIPYVARLLRSDDAWLRGMAAQTLLALDRRASVPFLVDLLTDDGSFDWMDDVRGMTVGRMAANALRGLVYQTIRARVPADENLNEMARRRALQRWFVYHTQYYDWKDHPKYGQYWFNGLALWTRTPAADLPSKQSRRPERFKSVLAIYPEDDSTHALFPCPGMIGLRLIFQNFGTDTVWIRWDKTDRNVHVLRMIVSVRPIHLPRDGDLGDTPRQVESW